MTRRRYFGLSVFDWMLVALFAGLGVLTGNLARSIGPLVAFVTKLPGGLQWLAGFHVLWLVVAVGLLRRPGVATITAVLMGGVEFLFGNQHGLAVLLLAVAAGLVVDLSWYWHRRRGRLIGMLLAGGFGAGLNVFVQAACMPNSCVCGSGVAISLAAGAAFFSGVLLGGGVAWLILHLPNGLGLKRALAKRVAETAATD